MFFKGTKEPELAHCHGTLPTPGPGMRVHACRRGGTMQHLWITEQKKNGMVSHFFFLCYDPGMSLYQIRPLAVSGYGKKLRLNVYRQQRGCERGKDLFKEERSRQRRRRLTHSALTESRTWRPRSFLSHSALPAGAVCAVAVLRRVPAGSK